jgi:uncharacterized protein (DUF362 family)
MTRRDFLRGAGITAAATAVLLTGCKPKQPVPTTGTQSVVSIVKAQSYDRQLVRQKMEQMLDDIGGLDDVLAHGKRVAIKTNLTGGTSVRPLPGISEIDSYLTHPEVVRALCELLHDAGVSELFIVEAVYEKQSWPQYEYIDMAKEVGATLVDLNYADPYPDLVETPTGTNPLIYEKLKFNPILNEIDAFISVSKMKCHNALGVTHTMKNLVGLVPYRLYALNSGDTYRSGFHGKATELRKRLPSVVIDLNRARPVNLSIIDGILTAEAGEGPWIAAMTPIQPGVMFAGKDPVATDAVATAAMGFDPTSDYPDEPFVHAMNHLNMANAEGMGTNRLEQIKVIGPAIEDIKVQFKTSY